MTQQQKAAAVLDQLFNVGRYARTGLSVKFLRAYAGKKWVDENIALSPDALIGEAVQRALQGRYIMFYRGSHQNLNNLCFKPRGPRVHEIRIKILALHPIEKS